MDKTLITITAVFDGYTVRMTQQYHTRFDFGHYAYVIEKGGHVASVGQTGGSGMQGKISLDECEEVFRRWGRWGEQENFDALLQQEAA